jgi:hypothetical protein
MGIVMNGTSERGSDFRGLNLDLTFYIGYIHRVAWRVEVSDEFQAWWDGLDEAEQESVAAVEGLLEEKGPTLPFPHSSEIKGSRHGHMRELRIQHKGEPYRVLYAFDPRRAAILLLGGNKGGNDRWYEVNVPKADDVYDDYIAELTSEGLI